MLGLIYKPKHISQPGITNLSGPLFWDKGLSLKPKGKLAALIIPSSNINKTRLLFAFDETGQTDLSPEYSCLDTLGSLVMWSGQTSFTQVEVRIDLPATSFVAKQKMKLNTKRLDRIYSAAIYPPDDERGDRRPLPLFPAMHIRARQLEFNKTLTSSSWIELLSSNRIDLQSSLLYNDNALTGGFSGLPLVLLLAFIWHSWWLNGTNNPVKFAWWQAIKGVISSTPWVMTEKSKIRLKELLILTDYMMRNELPTYY